jgi:hypothetical protein
MSTNIFIRVEVNDNSSRPNICYNHQTNPNLYVEIEPIAGSLSYQVYISAALRIIIKLRIITNIAPKPFQNFTYFPTLQDAEDYAQAILTHNHFKVIPPSLIPYL